MRFIASDLCKIKTRMGRSEALRQAAREGRKEDVEIILRKEVNVNRQNKEGHSALHLAMNAAQPDIVTRLLARPETRLDILDQDGRTPLHAASTDLIHSGNLVAVIQGRERYSGDLAASIRVFCQDPRCTAEILNKPDKNGCSPLMLAVTQEKLGNLLEFEKVRGLNWNTRNKKGQCLMDVAKGMTGTFLRKNNDIIEVLEKRQVAEQLSWLQVRMLTVRMERA